MSLASVRSIVAEGDACGFLEARLELRFRSDLIPPDAAGIYSLPGCPVPNCGRICHTREPGLCRPHLDDWRTAGEPALDAWISKAPPRPLHTRGRSAAAGVFDLGRLAGLIRLEVAYGIQLRGSDLARGPLRANVINDLVDRLADHGVEALAELLDPARQAAVFGGSGAAKAMRSFVNQTVACLAESRGAWDTRRSVGECQNGTQRFVDLSQIEPTWLRDLICRWIEYRRASERGSPQHIGQQAAALARFAAFVWARDAARPIDITRDLLVEYLAEVNSLKRPDGDRYSAVYRRKLLGAVNAFLDEVRQLGWAPGLPANARYLAGELPTRGEPRPRCLSEFVMRQIERPESLARIRGDDYRTVITLMMTTGIRCGHAVALERGCLEEVPRPEGSLFYVRFYDTKSKKQMRLPIRDDVAASIRDQQRRVDEAYPDGSSPWLFPARTMNRAGDRHVTPPVINEELKRWCRELDVTDENGEPVLVTPHQFRHTCGTRWLNGGMPQHVVQELLGHRSPQMTAVYARLSDQTLREEWEKVQRVNIRGEALPLPEGEAADVEWLVENIGRATQALPNGYCTLPLQQSCPHANACLTCDSFATSQDFLPVLRDQLEHHQALLDAADANGQTRLAEINRAPVLNLTKIISGLESLPEQH